MNRHAAALAGATALLVALPWLALSRHHALPPSRLADVRPLVPRPAAPIDEVLTRAPFTPHDATAPDEAEAASEDDGGDADRDAPPRIVGIVGRLPDRAVVLVRRSSGGTRTLAVGESLGRWRLVSISADAALFSDGAHRVRVELPVGEPAQ